MYLYVIPPPPHYAMKPSVILKQKNPEFSKLPS